MTDIKSVPGKSSLLRRYHWFSRKMTSEKRVQKFHTDDASLARSGKCFWLAENLLPPIRGTTQIWGATRHQYGISALVSQTSFGGKTVVASLNVDCFRRLLSRLPESLLAGYVKSSLHAHYLVSYNFTSWFEGLHWDQGVPLCYAGPCLI